MKIKLMSFLLISFLFISCSTVNYTEQAKLTLQGSEKNKKELKNAAKYFNKTDQTDKLDALIFLYENMPNHSYVKVGLFDENEVEVNWNFETFKDYNEAKTAMDSLEAEFGELHWKKKEKRIDHQTITSEYLVDNIDLAFKAWEDKPWSKKYDYSIFKEYILPYRGSNEPIESWRSWRGYFLDRYKDIASQMFDKTDIIEAAEIINNDLKTWFKFNAKYYLHPTDQGLFEMLMSKEGRCEDMTNLSIYALRANGIGATSDYTPHWANSGNNHAWNVIVMPDGKPIPFMGAEADPGKYKLSNKVAKVYRKVFSEQKDNLAFKLKDNEKAPAWLGGKCYMDVTGEYTNVVDVDITLDRDIPDSTNYLYLCVFNSGDWKAIHWAELKGRSAEFSDMGVDIAYLPMFYIEEELLPAGDPFILTKNGDKKLLGGDEQFNDKVILHSVTKKNIDRAESGGSTVFFEVGAEYELSYWENGWKPFGTKMALGAPLTFEDLPAKRLYWLVKENSDKEERIFTYDNLKQIWW
ncbi:MAG: transglutaminase-like domain-containing protein [Candidatus Tenebribacter davisii]|nr:transglutaminase-like domain-containing protein [Candidatus Tenebribacter davisii]